MNSLFRRLASASAAFALVAAAQADLKVVAQTKMSLNGDYRPTEYATIYYKGDWIRIDEKDVTTLTNPILHKSFRLDHQTKTYSVSASAFGSNMGDMFKSLQPKLTVSVRPTGQVKDVLAHQATLFDTDLDLDLTPPQLQGQTAHMKGKLETWTVSDLTVKDATSTMLEGENSLIGMLVPTGSTKDAFAEFGKITGYPVSYQLTMDIETDAMPTGSVTLELDYDVISLSEQSLNRALFIVPSDYKKEDDEDDNTISMPWNG